MQGETYIRKKITSAKGNKLPREVGIIPESIQKMCRYGPEGHGLLVDLAMLGQWLDSMIFFPSQKIL